MWPYTGVDPRVAEVILRSKRPRDDSPQRVALAAALCPEILSEKKVWTRNPVSIVEAEKMGAQCDRSMSQIKAAVASWVETFHERAAGFGGSSSPGAALNALLRWDRSLAVWVAAHLAQSVARFAHEESAKDARTAARWRVDQLIEAAREWVLTGSRKPTPAESISMEQRFTAAMNMSENILWYARNEARMTQSELRSMEQSALAVQVAAAPAGMVFTVDPFERERTAFMAASTSAVLLTPKGGYTNTGNKTTLELMANAVITYPRHYIGGSGALFDGGASLVPAAVVGAILGAGAMHWSKR